MRRRRTLRSSSAYRLFGVMVLALLLLTQAISTANAAGGVPVLRDFEDRPAGTLIFNQYVGVTFVGGDSTNFDGSNRFSIVNPGVATASGTRVLQDNYQSSVEFSGNAMLMKFDIAQSSVTLSTGLPAGIVNGTMLMQGFDKDPTQPGSTMLAQTVLPCLGNGPTPITHNLGVTVGATPAITYTLLSLTDCASPTTTTSGPIGVHLLVDNLAYDRPLNPPPGEHDPPVITVTSPTEGATVTSAIPGATSTDVLANVKEDALATLTATINGHAVKIVTFSHTDAHNYTAVVYLDPTDGLIDGANTLVMTAVDFDNPPNTGTVTLHFTFHVKPFPPPSQVDIWPTAFEVNQAIDFGPRYLGTNELNLGGDGYRVTVPSNPRLIQGKPTVIRIYGAASGTTGDTLNVPADMRLSAANCTGTNCVIPGGESLPPMANATTPRLDGITVPAFNSPNSNPLAVAPTLGATWNFLIPGGFTTQDLVATVEVNEGNYFGFPRQPAVPECNASVPKTCSHNNTVEIHLHFQPAPVLIVDPVFLHITGTFKGTTFDPNVAVTDPAQFDKMIAFMNEVYPLDVRAGSRFDRTIDAGMSGNDLTDFIGNFDASSSNEFFLGLLPESKTGLIGPNGDVGNGVFVAGTAFTPGRGAWADDDNLADPAHELAHNMGFEHWACENGTTDDECGIFPIPHGGIGGYGFDIVNWRLIPPGDNSTNATPHAHDFMTYGQICDAPGNGGGPGCDTGEWVSWYTYDILFTNHGIDSYDPDDPPAWLMRGHVNPAGTATFSSIFQISVDHPIVDTIVEDDTDQLYTLQGTDAGGNVLFVHNFEPRRIDIHLSTVGEVLDINEPVPVVAGVVKVTLRKGNKVLGSISNPAVGKIPTVTITSPTAGATWPVGTPQTIRWTASSPAGLPLTALVEYSTDGGTTRTRLGIDIAGGSLTINPDELAGSTSATIYVEVSDGMNTASASVGPITVAPKPPTAHIRTPRTGNSILAHVPLTAQGSAFDRQETLTNAAFKWSSDRDGALGTGPQLTLTALSAGTHTLTLTVTDSKGLTGTDSVTLTVTASSGPPAAATNLQFYPLSKPVRLLDTRAGATAFVHPGATLTAAQTLNLPGQFTYQGVTVPPTAQAIVGNATVANDANKTPAGFATLFPGGATLPLASNLNFVPGTVRPNAFTVALGNDGSFNLYSSSGGDFVIDVTGYYAPPGTGGLFFHALPAPVRLLDTRAGATAFVHPGATLTAAQTLNLPGQFTYQGATIPASATAVVGNATVANDANKTPAGFATLFPGGVPLPLASNLNFVPGQVAPNAFVVGLGGNGSFNLYSSTGGDFIIDVTGYFDTVGTGGLLFNTVSNPVRLLDTRSGQTAFKATGATLTAGQTLNLPGQFTYQGVTIPGAARALVGNATVANDANATPAGFATLFPGGATLPLTSNLNYVAKQVAPNAFVVGLGGDGSFNLYASTGGDFVIDVTGYFAGGPGTSSVAPSATSSTTSGESPATPVPIPKP